MSSVQLNHAFVVFCDVTMCIFYIIGFRYEDTENNMVYMFDGDSGLLAEISSTLDNSTITIVYNDALLPQYFSHNNGQRLRISYSDIGRITSVDLMDKNDAIVASR